MIQRHKSSRPLRMKKEGKDKQVEPKRAFVVFLFPSFLL